MIEAHRQMARSSALPMADIHAPSRIPNSENPMTRALCLCFAASILIGCGETAEFNADASYSPESLAQEFAFRYKALPARATPRQRALAEAREKAKAAIPDVDAQTKSARSEEATKAADAPTLEKLIAETDGKLARVPKMSRAEAGQKFVEALGKDGGIDAEDLAEISGKLAK
ncbi:hypothetical protein P12x_005878 [Tundrisphaera lichenicola]|uniref:hypothetical protein n=1 Tax=Tundrisphaera lichenicola TaxID=2029860 RepID=UPI003EC09A8E